MNAERCGPASQFLGWVKEGCYPFTPGFNVDPLPQSRSFFSMKLRHFINRLSRLNLNKAAREATALKKEFRRQDEELYRQGRGDEVLADRKKSLGLSNSGSTRLLTVNGVKIKS